MLHRRVAASRGWIRTAELPVVVRVHVDDVMLLGEVAGGDRQVVSILSVTSTAGHFSMRGTVRILREAPSLRTRALLHDVAQRRRCVRWLVEWLRRVRGAEFGWGSLGRRKLHRRQREGLDILRWLLVQHDESTLAVGSSSRQRCLSGLDDGGCERRVELRCRRMGIANGVVLDGRKLCWFGCARRVLRRSVPSPGLLSLAGSEAAAVHECAAADEAEEEEGAAARDPDDDLHERIIATLLIWFRATAGLCEVLTTVALIDQATHSHADTHAEESECDGEDDPERAADARAAGTCKLQEAVSVGVWRM